MSAREKLVETAVDAGDDPVGEDVNRWSDTDRGTSSPDSIQRSPSVLSPEGAHVICSRRLPGSESNDLLVSTTPEEGAGMTLPAPSSGVVEQTGAGRALPAPVCSSHGLIHKKMHHLSHNRISISAAAIQSLEWPALNNVGTDEYRYHDRNMSAGPVFGPDTARFSSMGIRPNASHGVRSTKDMTRPDPPSDRVSSGQIVVPPHASRPVKNIKKSLAPTWSDQSRKTDQIRKDDTAEKTSITNVTFIPKLLNRPSKRPSTDMHLGLSKRLGTDMHLGLSKRPSTDMHLRLSKRPSTDMHLRPVTRILYGEVRFDLTWIAQSSSWLRSLILIIGWI